MLVIGVFLPVASSLAAPDITMTADIQRVKPADELEHPCGSRRTRQPDPGQAELI
jgi:hypothetical protein